MSRSALTIEARALRAQSEALAAAAERLEALAAAEERTGDAGPEVVVDRRTVVSLGVGPGDFDGAIARGELSAFRVGRRRCVRRVDVVAWLSRRAAAVSADGVDAVLAGLGVRGGAR